jgi:hypothetical protein
MHIQMIRPKRRTSFVMPVQLMIKCYSSIKGMKLPPPDYDNRFVEIAFLNYAKFCEGIFMFVHFD